MISQGHLKLLEEVDAKMVLNDRFFAVLVQAQLQALNTAIAHDAGSLALARIRAYEEITRR